MPHHLLQLPFSNEIRKLQLPQLCGFQSRRKVGTAKIGKADFERKNLIEAGANELMLGCVG